ncbi:MAG: hypothetical protein ACR2PY_05295 [Salinispira sp.]
MRLAVLLFFLFINGFSGNLLPAQDEGSNRENTGDNILRIYINVRVLQNNNEVIWNFDIDEWTIPGKGVDLHLSGGNIIVDVEFVPFRNRNETITLIAQGEAWVRNNTDNKMRYQTSLKSIPINSGAPVIFYPLGIDAGNEQSANLELEILVSEYQLVVTAADTAESERQ